jgi:hypothetical protein
LSTVSTGERSEVEIIIDGSCLGNPGPGGWACILRYGEHERVLQGGVPDATNNRMELAAAIETEVETTWRYRLTNRKSTSAGLGADHQFAFRGSYLRLSSQGR